MTISPQLPRVFHWKVGVVSLGIYAGLYTWRWSIFDTETSVQDQVYMSQVRKDSRQSNSSQQSEIVHDTHMYLHLSECCGKTTHVLQVKDRIPCMSILQMQGSVPTYSDM